MARYGMEYGWPGNRNRGRGFGMGRTGYGADYDTGRGRSFYGANFGNYGYTGRGNVGTDYWGGEYETGYGGGASYGMGRGEPGYGRNRGLSYGAARNWGFGGRGPGNRPRGFGGYETRGLRGYDRTSYGVGYGDRAETFTAGDIAYRHGYDRGL